MLTRVFITKSRRNVGVDNVYELSIDFVRKCAWTLLNAILKVIVGKLKQAVNSSVKTIA